MLDHSSILRFRMARIRNDIYIPDPDPARFYILGHPGFGSSSDPKLKPQKDILCDINEAQQKL
jgi:hypothetical protein